MLVIRMYYGADAFMEVVRMSMLCKRRLLFLEAVRIKSAPCVLYRKIRRRVTRMTMRAMCHYKMRAMCLSEGGVPATCLSEGGVPTMPPFLTCLFCLRKKWAG